MPVMTLNMFLDDYVLRVLRPLEGWTADAGAIRCVLKVGQVDIACCPLTAEARLYAGCAETQGERLGLSARDRMAVMNAADGEPGRVRDRLLIGLGLMPRGDFARHSDVEIPEEIDPKEIPY